MQILVQQVALDPEMLPGAANVAGPQSPFQVAKF